MQQAIPYKSWPLPCVRTAIVADNNNNNHVLSRSGSRGGSSKDMVSSIVSENAVIVFAKKGCCMSHVARRLLLALGVNPAVYEIDEEEEEVSVLKELGMICEERGSKDHKTLQQLPAVFIGGKLFGGLDKLLATHISGELVPVLKDAGALWL